MLLLLSISRSLLCLCPILRNVVGVQNKCETIYNTSNTHPTRQIRNDLMRTLRRFVVNPSIVDTLYIQSRLVYQMLTTNTDTTKATYISFDGGQCPSSLPPSSSHSPSRVVSRKAVITGRRTSIEIQIPFVLCGDLVHQFAPSFGERCAAVRSAEGSGDPTTRFHPYR